MNKTNPSFRRGGIINNEHTDTVVESAEAQKALRQAARAAWLKTPAGQAELQRKMQSVNQNVLARGGGPTSGQSAAEVAQFANQQRLADSSEQLRNIATGRNYLERKVLPVAGAVAGGMSPMGLASGMLLGTASASRAPALADALGEIGQGLATSGKDAIKQSALRLANDPLKLQRLADVPGAMGNAARWALEKAQDPAAFAARSYMLQLRPEFRRAMIGDGEGDQATR
jgi:hypothetical protein